MINIDKVVKYIEETNKVRLYDWQREILKHIIRGDIIYTPRGCGRTMLVNGYADYMKKHLGKTSYLNNKNDYDVVFTYEDCSPNVGVSIKDYIRLAKNNPTLFEREFEAIFKSKVQ